MKKILIGIIIFSILILDLLALDDITTGNEPNYFVEYAILFISIPIGFSAFFLLKKSISCRFPKIFKK